MFVRQEKPVIVIQEFEYLIFLEGLQEAFTALNQTSEHEIKICYQESIQMCTNGSEGTVHILESGQKKVEIESPAIFYVLLETVFKIMPHSILFLYEEHKVFEMLRSAYRDMDQNGRETLVETLQKCSDETGLLNEVCIKSGAEDHARLYSRMIIHSDALSGLLVFEETLLMTQ